MQGRHFLLYGGNTLDKYRVEILKGAYENIDDIYAYISNELLVPDSAINIVDKFEQCIFSLETMPMRFPIRRTGRYSNKGYRQIFVEDFIIIFRINTLDKVVTVVTVKYAKSNF